MDTYLTSPVLNLSGCPNPYLTFCFYLDSEPCCDFFYVQALCGGTWTTIYGPVSGLTAAWQTVNLPITNTCTQIRFYFHSDFSVTYEGDYVDCVCISCGQLPGLPTTTPTFTPTRSQTFTVSPTPIVCTPACGGNLAVNGGFENGTTSGWTVTTSCTNTSAGCSGYGCGFAGSNGPANGCQGSGACCCTWQMNPCIGLFPQAACGGYGGVVWSGEGGGTCGGPANSWTQICQTVALPAGGATVSFYYAAGFEFASPSSGIVDFSVTLGGASAPCSPTNFWSMTFPSPNCQAWNQARLNLCGFGGCTVTVCGRATSTGVDCSWAYIDELEVCPCLVGTPTNTPTVTLTPTITLSNTLTATATTTNTATISATATSTPTVTWSPTITTTPTSTATPTISSTFTVTATVTSTSTITITSTPTATATISSTHTVTATVTPTATFTVTSTPSATPSITQTFTITFTPTWTYTVTPTATITNTFTPSCTPTITPTSTITLTPTSSATVTPTPTVTQTSVVPPPFFRIGENQVSPPNLLHVSWVLAESGHMNMTVFNSAGEYVRTIFDDDVASQTLLFATWDLTNYLGAAVSSNVYILRVSAPGFLRNYKIGVLR